MIFTDWCADTRNKLAKIHYELSTTKALGEAKMTQQEVNMCQNNIKKVLRLFDSAFLHKEKDAKKKEKDILMKFKNSYENGRK